MRKADSSVFFLILIMMSVFFIGYFQPENTQFIKEYIFLGINMIAFIFVNIVAFMKFSIYLFEPVFLVFIVYLFVFFIDPMVNIISGTTECMGYYVMDGCIRATVIFMLSYVMFLLGYYGVWRRKDHILSEEAYVYKIREWKNTNIENIALFLWMGSFAFGCIELISKGMSIGYFLTLGLSGEMDNLYADSAFGFFGNFRYSMISSWVYLFVCDSKSFKTKICGVLTLEYFVLRGFRHSLFVLIFSPIVYYFVKDKKKPKLKSILVISILAVLVMGIMQFIRGALREGTSVDWSAFDTSIFIDSIKGNCDIYKTFYGMAVTVPNELEYQYGMASIVSVITMIIPRKIWPGKPISPIITNLHMFCGELAAKSGYAMPNISEYYLDFGVIGCIVMLFIFGQVLQKLKDLYRYKSYDRHGLILYSVMFPALLQVMLRGYSPSYMYLLFFYSFPVIIMKYFVDNKSLK